MLKRECLVCFLVFIEFVRELEEFIESYIIFVENEEKLFVEFLFNVECFYDIC